MKDRFGYKPPIDHKLGYAQSLARLKELFADNRDDDVGHRAQILPEVFYGAKTKRCLEIYESNEQWVDWLETPEQRCEVAKRTAALLYGYRYVVLGTNSSWGKRELERLLLRGPSVMRHELVQPPQEQLAAAELWRFRSGLLSYAQAKALCAHLNSFRRTSAHGKVLDWSICEGPGPDTGLSSWLQEKDGYSRHLHRNADGLAGFGIDGGFVDKVVQFKLVHRCRNAGKFSYRPAPPVIEPMYHLECIPKEDSLVDGCKLHIRVAKREHCADSTCRERVLKYADSVGAFPDVPEYETGRVTEHYYFLKDEEETGVPFVDCGMRPFEAVNELFTAEEALHVMKLLHASNYKEIRRVQDLKVYDWFNAGGGRDESGITLTSRCSLPEIGLTIELEGYFKEGSREYEIEIQKREEELRKAFPPESSVVRISERKK